MASFTKQNIIDQLDAAADREYRQFPDLDNASTYPVGARLSAYRDDKHWAMFFETLGYNPTAGSDGGVSIKLSKFGNCLKSAKSTAAVTLEFLVPDAGDRDRMREQLKRFRADVQGDPSETRVRIPIESADETHQEFLDVITDGPEGVPLEWGGGFYRLSDGANYICVQGQLLPVERDPVIYEKHGIVLDDPKRIESHELLRLIYPRFKEIFYVPEETLRERLAVHLPLVLRLYGWQHPRIMDGERPSQSPSLVAIAQMLEDGHWYDFVDPGTDNVHWRNWPAGGSL